MPRTPPGREVTLRVANGVPPDAMQRRFLTPFSVRACVLATCLFPSLAASGCGIVHIGNGHARTEMRSASGFDAIVSEGELDVTVVLGDTESVEITCDSNLLEYIEVETDGHALVIAEEEGHNIAPRATCVARVTAVRLVALESYGSGNLRARGTVSELESVTTMGSGNVHVENLGCEDLELVTTGSGNATITGVVAQASLQSTGSGNVNATDLVAQRGHVRTTGSGNVKLHATESVDIHSSGSGDVEVWGDPEHRRHEASGSGRIRYH